MGRSLPLIGVKVEPLIADSQDCRHRNNLLVAGLTVHRHALGIPAKASMAPIGFRQHERLALFEQAIFV
jgi:hypothetical protein